MIVNEKIDQLYRTESRRVFAALVRLLGDFDLAEEAMHDAFAAAIQQWEQDGIPENPCAWLISTGRFKAIDAVRRSSRFHKLAPQVSTRLEQIAAVNASVNDQEIDDDRLRLIFTCCHPAIDPKVQIPLTL